MTPGEIAMAIAMGVLLIAGGYAIAYRAGRNREREREPSEAALFAGHADADAVDACDARGGRHRHRFQRQCARRE